MVEKGQKNKASITIIGNEVIIALRIDTGHQVKRTFVQTFNYLFHAPLFSVICISQALLIFSENSSEIFYGE
jgi:hypothetical protein